MCRTLLVRARVRVRVRVGVGVLVCSPSARSGQRCSYRMVSGRWAYRAAYLTSVALPAALVAAHARIAPNDPAAQRRVRDMRKVPPAIARYRPRALTTGL